MPTPLKSADPTAKEKNWSIVVNSIGTAGAGLVKALIKDYSFIRK